jgi:hypothetical protein
MTSYRRTSPIPKLTCVPGNGFLNAVDANHACSEFAPSVVQCKNTGTDDEGHLTWECQADLSDWFSLGQTVVSCEGYSDPNDPYVLSGSCGLEYRLNLTPKGRQHFNKPVVAPIPKQVPNYADHYYQNQYQRFDSNYNAVNGVMSLLMTFIVFPLVMTILFWCCCTENYNYNNFSNSTTYQRPPVRHHHHTARPSSVPIGLRRRTTTTTNRSFTPPPSFGGSTFVSEPVNVFASVHTIPRPSVVSISQSVPVPPVVHQVHVPRPQKSYNGSNVSIPVSSTKSTSSNDISVNRTVKGFATTRNR